jgi:hypothetical protein
MFLGKDSFTSVCSPVQRATEAAGKNSVSYVSKNDEINRLWP